MTTHLDPSSDPTQRVRVGDVDIAYDIRGRGEPLLLVPGLTMRRMMWSDELCDLLAQMKFLVVRMDNRDAGDSTRLDGLRPPNVMALLRRSLLKLPFDVPYTLEDMAEDAFGLMSALGHDRFHVVGASMGGMIAQTMAIVRPERLRTMTSIMSGPGGRRYAIGKLAALRTLLTPMPRERSAQVEHLVGTFRVLNGDELPFDEANARRYAEVHCAAGVSRAASARQLSAIVHSSTRRLPLLQSVKTPTLVLHGSADPLMPMRGAVAMARQIRDAELLVVRGMGHNLPVTAVPFLAGAIATFARKAAWGTTDPALV
jgi:pimeloyl-ACP methyl ester carboxylesterase